jgi:phenylalanyl-tRNA synthetase beta chain
MIISVSWLRELVHTTASTQEIADALSVSGLEVEHQDVWESVPGGMQGFVIGEVKTCSKHPNADKLSVTTVDVGAAELSPIVCGAPNVAAGQKVIVALPGATVTVPGKGTFVIGEAKIRGEVSRGMICAEDEAGLGTSHDGIMVLPADAPVGMLAADYFGVVRDEILEIGLTANRGDAASHLGVARDVAALFQTTVTLPEIPARPLGTGKFQFVIENPEFCSYYFGLDIENTQVSASPDAIQNRLRAIGIEPKNAIVDATNYTLHTLGQPVHAFDADKIRGNTIRVRLAQAGETFTTLDKVARTAKGGELVIADEGGIIALAGVMGGLESAVSETTTRVLIESAHFNPSLVRKTARAHGLNTDASFRFERSTDSQMCRKAAFYTADRIMASCGGTSTTANHHLAHEFEAKKLTLYPSKLTAFAGTDIPEAEIHSILTSLGFELNTISEGIEVTVPSWRNDVIDTVDLYEEVMRIYGYDKIPLTGKMRASLPAFTGMFSQQKTNMASAFLIAQGFHEIMNNSLTSAAHVVVDEAVRLTNPLSTDMEYMRSSLLPGMLQSAAYNRNRKAHNIHFFEFGRTYRRVAGKTEEIQKLALLVGGNETEESWETKAKTAGYYFLRRVVENMLHTLGIAKDLDTLFTIEKVTANALKAADVEGEFWYVEMDWAALMQAASKGSQKRVIAPPKFPFMRRDLSLVVDKSMHFESLKAAIDSRKEPLLKKINVFDVFEGKPLEAGKKAIAIAFYLGHDESTLTDELADTAMQGFIASFEKIGATIRR